MRCDSGGWAMCRRCAARPNCSSSLSTTKYLRWWMSMPHHISLVSPRVDFDVRRVTFRGGLMGQTPSKTAKENHPMSQDILFEQTGSTAIITLNRPDKLNA